MSETVYVVHSVDTEGPLYENLEVKFERLEAIFGVHLEPTPENFRRVCEGKIDLGGKEALAKQIFSSHLANYMEDWNQIDAMLTRAMSEDFRLKSPDSFGGPYLYNWFCLDHVGYRTNPRRRMLGYHVIFDHYRELLSKRGETRDGLHWHAHPVSTYREANRCATSLLNSPEILEGLARRIIERQWFPSCYRAGFQTERPDIHWFLEQYIPFDFSNTSVEDAQELESQADLAEGRFGDWRLAPKDWGVYHPSHDNYQLPGNCRRWIARSLNVLNRFANLDAFEVEKAFRQAKEGRPTLLGVASHDFRDLAPEVDHIRGLLKAASLKYPGVRYRFSEAREAFRAVAYGGQIGPELKLKAELHHDTNGKLTHLTVQAVQGRVFGPQPFLAIQTASNRFIHDNFDFSTDQRSWRYIFDCESVLPEDVKAVGVGASDAYGHVAVAVLKAEQRVPAEVAVL